ncbi:CU044_5270 family protein [Amycolatopsis aidingensis]|uniref:CU044_5270 family protein n=1 Tax=Amycolatopsis aidingensis TaxID=2842453 RepID=UPI001C0B5784|nr:CU044_5270 family protein [Amycolatopsis aidingensis]
MPDDLDLNVVRGLRADVPEMSEQAFEDGRAQLVAATEGKGVVPLPRRPPRKQSFRGRLLPVAAAATVAIAGAGVAAVTLAGDEGKAPVAGTAPESHVLPPLPAEPLNRAGELADRVRDIQLAPGQYLYLEKQEWDHGRKHDKPTRTWIPKDRSADWLAISPEGNEAHSAGGFGVGEFLPNQGNFERLPRDPKALYELLRHQVGSHEDPARTAFEQIVTLLSGAAPEPLRATLYRVLGYLPQLTVTPGAFTKDGRSAISIEMRWVDGHRSSTELLVDPDTGLVIGQHGRYETESTIRYAVVDRMGQVPPR